jgi:hypothetical protein
MTKEEAEQSKLLGGQVQGMTSPLGLLRRQLDAHVTIGQRGNLDRTLAPDQGASTVQQLLESERFAQVVVGPAVEAAHPVADGVPGCEEKDGRRPPACAVFEQDFQTIPAGQPPVEDHQLVLARPEHLGRRIAVGCMVDGKALVRQPVDDGASQACVVLDEQHPLFHDPPGERALPIVAIMSRTPTSLD